MALEGNVKIPVIGEVDKKYAVYGGIAAVGIVVIVYIRKRNAGGSSAASGQSGIDPATGFAYGSPEDQQALQDSTGSSYGAGYGGQIDPATGVPYAYEYGAGVGGPGAGTGTGTTTTPQTRDEWLMQAENDLNAPNLSSIAPRVWAGIAVTANEKDVFLEAVALEGAPPGGYPTPIKVTDTKGHPGKSKHHVTVPNVRGKRGAIARAELTAKGFKVREEPTGVPHGESSVVESQDPSGGTQAVSGSEVIIHLRITK